MEYSQPFRDYFQHTQHAGRLNGQDIIIRRHESVNPFDQFTFYLDIANNTIKQAHFESSSTPALIAAGEYTCRWLENKSLVEAASLQKEQILQELDLDQRFIHVADLICRLLQRYTEVPMRANT